MLNFMVYFMGVLGIVGWLLHLFLILKAFFNDQSTALGYPENYGMIVMGYNRYGEMLIEIFLMVFILIFIVITTIIILFKKEVDQNEIE